MSQGFQQAGIQLLAGIDIDDDCRETYESNIRQSMFIHADIKTLSFSKFAQLTKISKDDDSLVFIGCSPCQYWSKIKTNKTKSESTKNLLGDFQRFVGHFRPGFVVVENVPGILSHKHHSQLEDFLTFLRKRKYEYKYQVINAGHYGVPQTRKRFLLVASRISDNIDLPAPDASSCPTVRSFIGEKKEFPVLPAGHIDTTCAMHTTAGLSKINLERIKATPHDGGTRLSYVGKKKLAIPSHYQNSQSFSDTYGRMSWDKPAPTITTKFISLSNGRFGHPDQDRALSLREGATLQTFEKSYRFFGASLASLARQIGNAVPPALSYRIALAIIKSWQK